MAVDPHRSALSAARTALTGLALGLLLPGVAAAQLTWLEAHFHTQLSFDGLQTATDVVVSPDGAFVYVSGRRDDAISWFARDDATGLLTYQGRVLYAQVGDGTIPNLERPFFLAASPDGAHLYAGGGSAALTTKGFVIAFELDPVTGEPGYLASYLDGAPGQPLLASLGQVAGLAVSQDGKNVYAGSVSDDAVTVFSRAALTGLLTPVQVVTNGVGGAPRGIAFSPDGDHVYVASSGGSVGSGLGVFARDLDTGELTFVERFINGQNGVTNMEDVRDVVVSPDGAHVYAACAGSSGSLAGSGSIVRFARNGSTGGLTFGEAITATTLGVTQPNGLAFLPDGGRLLMVSQGRQGAAIGGVASGFDGRLTLFSREPSTGVLSVLDQIEDSDDGANGVDGLRGAFQVALSPDAGFAYVASEQDFLSVDPPTGSERGGAVASIRVPEPGTAAAGLVTLATLAALARRRR
jgi:6-phosphogluconolactonase (cycloisomerase 2 family)